MRTLTIQQQPNGFELEAPSFGYWVKAGMGLAAGAMVIGFVAWLCSLVLLAGVLTSFSRSLLH